MEDQRDYAEEAFNRAQIEQEKLAEATGVTYEVTIKRTFEIKLGKSMDEVPGELEGAIIASYDEGIARVGTVYHIAVGDHRLWEVRPDDAKLHDLETVVDQVTFEIRETNYELN